MFCTVCGVEGPTKHVKFYQNIGMLVKRQWVQIEGDLCRPCIGRYFRAYTITTLMIGWFGVISLLVTPFILLNNIIQYLRAIGMPDPELSAIQMSDGSAPRQVGPGSLKLPLILGGIAWSVVLGVVASQQTFLVDYLEKHAPSLNAKLHSGEITDETDSTYAFLRIGKDIKGLEAATKSREWVGMRSELLTREPLLIDLNDQNDKTQRRIQIERNANLGASDACEKWTLDDLGPALNNYILAENKMFALIKNTPSPSTEAVASAMDVLQREHDKDLSKLSDSFSDSASHACDK